MAVPSTTSTPAARPQYSSVLAIMPCDSVKTAV
ncbi:Uncharacterised protein [Bordetella pertussis]|nr:Uncharacterised protein [Bordetella pertussis]CFU08631.1 Uncharacterised protein [Bordetella pertussis]CFW04964.1 Uncharacterised protein [Bordetella pertussis]CPO93852.1 Uncharacterised protein [Bordetella pertussis]